MGKIIQLTKGLITIVDDEDFEKYGLYKWYASWSSGVNMYYAKRHSLRDGKRVTSYLHRLIVGALENEIVDHINHNTLDNQKVNLRKATHAQNLANRRQAQSNNTSGYRGVSWFEPMKKWRVYVHASGVQTHLGYFSNIQDAAKAAQAARAKYFGEFAGAD